MTIEGTPPTTPPATQPVKRRGMSGTAWIVVGVLAAAVAYLLYEQIDTRVGANVATEQRQDAQDDAADARQDAKDVADPLWALCQQDPEVRRRVGALCDKAGEVKDQPTPTPADGANGRDGRGIATTIIRDGRLLITYTDGAIEDVGRVIGQGGKPGKAGRNGRVGEDGEDGRSITGTAIVDGQLVLSYSDGTSETAGRVVGENGRDGRGIAATAIRDGRLVVTYTDGETVDVGPLPAGRGVASVAFDMAACVATVTYTDGVVDQSPMTGCEPAQPTSAPTPGPSSEPAPEPSDLPPLRLPGG